MALVDYFFLSVCYAAGTSVDIHSPDSLNCLLPNVANDALKRALNAYQEPEDTLTEEDLALAASLE